jgi:hypothetical protein
MSTRLGEGKERKDMLLKLSRSTLELDLSLLNGAQILGSERVERVESLFLLWGTQMNNGEE